MQLWTTEMWQAASIGLIIGMLIGYLIVRFTKGSIKHQMQTKTELKNVKAQLEAQNVQLEKHFAESAELFKTLIGDYQKLYRHYAHSSDTLLGKNPKGLFTQQLVTAADKPQEEPPRDYSEGSSGLFKPNEEKA
ncbi:Putative cytochrome d ubiquinol oxidase subunit 3 [Stutzerimonas stutzeri]|nr:Putative cytochrome d ubiquinol oxidase subunit 3 [Stutzerimonas stutzeri]